MAKNKNDKKILDLQKKVAYQKEFLAKAQRFTPKTNCTLAFEGDRYNLNTLDVYACIILAVRLNSYRLSAKDLNVEGLVISGFSLEDWIADLTAKLSHLQRREESQKLKATEKKLQDLLSADTQTEIAIDDIAKALS